MNVVVASGGRFTSFHLVHQLWKRQCLLKFLTASYTRTDRQSVSPELVQQNKVLPLLNRIYHQFRLSSILAKQSWNAFKDDQFDFWLGKQLKNMNTRPDIFVGWSHYWLYSVPIVRDLGAKIVLESGSCHILEQRRLLQAEYEKFKLKQPPLSPKTVSKTLREYETADCIMVPAQHVARSFVQHTISPQKIRVVPYGVDYERFRFPDKTRPPVFRVLFVGLVGFRKGVYYLLEAWNKVKKILNQAELWIVGAIEPDFKPVLNTCHVPENVKFLGPVSYPKLRELYRSVSVFVLPSLEEGWALVLAEAMASGLPLICTPNTGGPELITEGAEGFIVPAQNAALLAERLRWCFENQDTCFDMGRRASLKIKNFSWDNYGNRVMPVYNQLLDQQ